MIFGRNDRNTENVRQQRPDLFEHATFGTYFKYGAVTLIIGVSVVSLLTQGVLMLRDAVFKQPVEAATASASEAAQAAASASANARDASGEPPINATRSGAVFNPTFTGTKQYSLINPSQAMPKLTSPAYLAADLDTGEIIVEQGGQTVAPLASVSKLMTATIAEEEIDMQKVATVSAQAYDTFGTEGELQLGEQISVYDLMVPLLMESSNDGAEELAEVCDKGRDAFMDEMNRKAAELGMTNTYYEDPSGLDPKNTSTVEDQLKLTRYIYEKDPEIWDMTKVKQYSILGHSWLNRNAFLKYDYFLGGKNGYIDQSKKTMAAIFNITLAKGGTHHIAIELLLSDDREGDGLKIIKYLENNVQFNAASSTATTSAVVGQ